MSPLLFCCVGNTFQSPLLAALYNAEAEATGNPSRAISAGLSNRTVMPPTAAYLFESVARTVSDRPGVLAALRAHQPTPLRTMPFQNVAGACLVHEPARKAKDLADDEKAMRTWLTPEPATPLMKLAIDDPGYREWKARGEPALDSPDGEAVLQVYAQQVAVIRAMATALAAATKEHPDTPPLPVVQPPPPPSATQPAPEAEVVVMRVRIKTGEVPMPPPVFDDLHVEGRRFEERRPEPPPPPPPTPEVSTPTPRPTVRKIVGVLKPSPTPAVGTTRKPEHTAGAKSPATAPKPAASPMQRPSVSTAVTGSPASTGAASTGTAITGTASIGVASHVPPTHVLLTPTPAVSAPEISPRVEPAKPASADASSTPVSRAASAATTAATRRKAAAKPSVAEAAPSSEAERDEALEDVRAWLRAALPLSKAALTRHGLWQRAEKHFTSWDEAVRIAGIAPAEPLWQLPRDPDLSLDILVEALPDDVVARVASLDVKKVRARRKANDAPDPANQLRRRLVASEQLGKVPDAELAEQLLIPVEVVVAVREVEGIAPCAPKRAPKGK